jgi:hypothetical protein
MTKTISRLYDNYSDAQRAVSRLESAGVPHSDISIVANNSENWYRPGAKVDRDRDGVDDRAEGAGTGAGIGAGLGGQRDYLPVWDCWLFRGWGPLSLQDGLHPQPLALRPVQRREESLGP